MSYPPKEAAARIAAVIREAEGIMRGLPPCQLRATLANAITCLECARYLAGKERQ